jgi:hypothetical protein
MLLWLAFIDSAAPSLQLPSAVVYQLDIVWLQEQQQRLQST